MNRDPRPDALYRKPQLGITVLLVVAVWSIALPVIGTILAWSIDASTGDDSFRDYVSKAWTRGVIYGGLSWCLWILSGIRPRSLAALLIATLAFSAGSLLSRFSERDMLYQMVNVTGIILASAATNFLIGLPQWSFRSRHIFAPTALQPRSEPDFGDGDTGTRLFESQDLHRRQFSIFNLMLITLVVAILIVMARQLPVAAATGEVFWAISVIIWMGLSITSSLIYLASLRTDRIGPFLFAIAGIALSGLIVAAMCTAELIQKNNQSSHTFVLLYGVLVGGHLMTATVFAVATCVQSMRSET